MRSRIMMNKKSRTYKSSIKRNIPRRAPLKIGGTSFVVNEVLEENVIVNFNRISSRKFKIKVLKHLANSIGISIDETKVILPSKAPLLWKSDHHFDDPSSFIAEVYKEWLGQGLTQAHIRQLDKSLYDALHYWMRSNELTINLPTKKEFNDRMVKAFAIASRASLRRAIMTPEARAAQNLYATALRRHP